MPSSMTREQYKLLDEISFPWKRDMRQSSQRVCSDPAIRSSTHVMEIATMHTLA